MLDNKTFIGTVISNRGHYEKAVKLRAEAEERWPILLSKIMPRCLQIDSFVFTLNPTPDNIKTMVQIL
ncbi:hypothetical protein ACFLWX_02860 [Chloroflexota bacterium]